MRLDLIWIEIFGTSLPDPDIRSAVIRLLVIDSNNINTLIYQCLQSVNTHKEEEKPQLIFFKLT